MKLKLWRSLLFGLFLSNAIVYAALRSASQVKAQIIPDGTTNTSVNSTDNGIIIDEGDRSGDNLFHSFEQFSVPNGGEAFFNNANDIANIFSRVTGGDISNIDGLIRANGDASLFLINPAGIVFGEGAALNLGGSFFASTAESIVFTDNVEFSATDADEPPLLTINQPLGLNFGNDPGDIAVNGSNLQVGNSETLALFGGNVTITRGQIIAPGANIELGGLTAAGQISFTQSENTFNSFSFPEAIARGDVTLTNGAEVNVQAAGGGNIGINAGNIQLSGGTIGASNIVGGVASESRSPQTQAGNVVIDATGDITVEQGSAIRNRVEESAVGNSGGINITTTNLSLTEGGQVNSNTSGLGNTGTIIIEADGTIEADGLGQNSFNSGIFNQVEESAVGNSGGINITTTNLSLTRDAKVDASTLAQGDAGGINIIADNLFLIEGGQVNASTLFGRGNAGTITITASDTIEADGEGPNGFSSAILSLVQESAEGNSGGINITTTNLKLTRGAEVNAGTLADSQGNAGEINIQASGAIEVDGLGQDQIGSGIYNQIEELAVGNSGGINITADNLSLTDGGQINASTFGLGNAGTIVINANNTIELDGFSSAILSLVQVSAEGNSGEIDITTTDLKLTRGAEVNASVLDGSQGDAGEINIQASGTVEADGLGQDGFGSGIYSIVDTAKTGNPSKINITATDLKLARGAEVNTSNFSGQTDAGEINIITDNLSLIEGGQINANTSSLGDGGVINIQANDTIEADGERLSVDGSFVSSGIFSIVKQFSEGNSGGINITTANLKLTGGAEINASTLASSQGDAGKIVIQSSDTIEADGRGQDGFSSGIFSVVDAVGTGNSGGIDLTTTDLKLTGGAQVNASTFFGQRDAGGINITVDNLSLADNAEISVESRGEGNAGNLSIQANTVALSNGASLFASTAVDTGGNITLQISDNLTLQSNSTISARALENANGGNIDLKANFVIAQPNQNNDIIASAAEGTGGNINITTNAIFGLEARSSIPDNNTNDIDASSEFGLDGTVEINELDVNPTEALEELPTEVIDVTGLVEQNLCQQGQGSEFIVTGKGGTAPSPTQARDGSVSKVDLVKPVPYFRAERVEANSINEEETIEAQGWVINDRGTIELVARKTDVDSSTAQPKSIQVCHQQ